MLLELLTLEYIRRMDKNLDYLVSLTVIAIVVWLSKGVLWVNFLFVSNSALHLAPFQFFIWRWKCRCTIPSNELNRQKP